jgi:hypothetical protein
MISTYGKGVWTAPKRPRRKGQRFIPSKTGRGVAMVDENITFIPADCILKPLRDQIIIAPMDVLHSRILVIPPHESRLVRGTVVAHGPGVYPTVYADKWGDRLPDHARKRRAMSMAGTVFRPISVKVGDIVHLDGRISGVKSFDAFYWGDRYCIHAREEDIAACEES